MFSAAQAFFPQVRILDFLEQRDLDWPPPLPSFTKERFDKREAISTKEGEKIYWPRRRRQFTLSDPSREEGQQRAALDGVCT